MQQKEGHHSGATHSSSHEEWSDTFVAHNRDAGSLSRVLREQQQSYAAQGPTSDERWQSYTQHAPLEPSSGEQMQMFAPPLEASPDEQTSIERQQDPIAGSSQHSEYSASALAAQGEKITSFSRQRRSSKGWWILIVVVALLFFMLGRIVTVSTSPVPISFTSAIPVSHEHKLPTGFSQNDKGIPFENHLLNSQSLLQARQMIADGLHLSPDAITQQLQAGHTMQDIASTQGVDPDQLHNIELKAITLLINTEAQVGDIDASYASDTINHLQNSSDTLDNMAALLFTSPQLNTTKQSPGASQILSNPALSYQAQHQIASDLHLTSQDVTKQLQSGKSLPDIAAAQGVSNNQLHSIELKAYSNVANTAVKSGDLTSGAADAWLKALSNNSQNLDQTTQDLFLNNNQSPNN